ncbi:hypothetical protein CGLO_09508 [Colletotrichum gloeosporioides Cg-14]|uniref:Uncharacterized protein n=1 Tax=Colletotrichum gloeosporioides (strain Cg-14) TaxID=1237896 RepID=T0K6A8_COLGC|nr:hypothetical protein CGLO_09508 [Colletotrichum gloeosporioides Cg-14]
MTLSPGGPRSPSPPPPHEYATDKDNHSNHSTN